MSPKDQEKQFQEAFTHWEQFHDKQSWDTMWIRVTEACKSMISVRLKGIKIDNDDFHEKILFASSDVMKRILQHGTHPKSLIGYVSSAVMMPLYGEKFKFQDRNLSYEADFSNPKAFSSLMANKEDNNG